MATTIAPKVLKKNRRRDGTWLVLWRLTHGRQARYVATGKYVTEEDLEGGDNIAQGYLVDHLAGELRALRRRLAGLSGTGLMTVDEVRDAVFGAERGEVDLIAAFGEIVERMRAEGRRATAGPSGAVLNALAEYSSGRLPASLFTSAFLRGYEAWLRMPRDIERPNGRGGTMTINGVCMTDRGMPGHMGRLRALWNAARGMLNDEERGIIPLPGDPFRKYKIPKRGATAHRNLCIADIRRLRDHGPSKAAVRFARDMFMLSFLLCGMNAADVHANWERLKALPERLGYQRSKTKGRRPDGAFISIAVPPAVRKLISEMEMPYAGAAALRSALSRGMRLLGAELGIGGLTMYHARHSFATIARNDLGHSRDDIAAALCHRAPGAGVTDVYLAPDWGAVDRVQAAVERYLAGEGRQGV